VKIRLIVILTVFSTIHTFCGKQVICSRWKTARDRKLVRFSWRLVLCSLVDGISVSRPAGSRNDARLVKPGKLLRRYTRPKGECTAKRYIYGGCMYTLRDVGRWTEKYVVFIYKVFQKCMTAWIQCIRLLWFFFGDIIKITDFSILKD